jgi:hypothetical protein
MIDAPGGLPAFLTTTVVAIAFQSVTTDAVAVTNGMTATQNASAAARTLRESSLIEILLATAGRFFMMPPSLKVDLLSKKVITNS